MSGQFSILDSGERKTFATGMVRDVDTGKTRYWRTFIGPMLKRWAEHLGKGAVKYNDVSVGIPNWTLARTPEELQRFKESAADHFIQWFRGEVDEDHAAGVIFNINGAEYVKEKLENELRFGNKNGSSEPLSGRSDYGVSAALAAGIQTVPTSNPHPDINTEAVRSDKHRPTGEYPLKVPQRDPGRMGQG